jgi:hypothetical protein
VLLKAHQHEKQPSPDAALDCDGRYRQWAGQAQAPVLDWEHRTNAQEIKQTIDRQVENHVKIYEHVSRCSGKAVTKNSNAGDNFDYDGQCQRSVGKISLYDWQGHAVGPVFEVVPATGLEPVQCYLLEPESSASANSATRAH